MEERYISPIKVIEWLRLPESRGIKDIDVPAATLLHAQTDCAAFAYQLIKTLEFALLPVNDRLGMFQTIELEKVARCLTGLQALQWQEET